MDRFSVNECRRNGYGFFLNFEPIDLILFEGNFISYAWAPASVVAPLGTVSYFTYPVFVTYSDQHSLQFALVANCMFSPLILGERFRKVILSSINVRLFLIFLQRDIFGVLISIIGAVTVVLSSNASDTRLNPGGLVHAISQTPFIIYACIYAVGALVLAFLSPTSYGKQHVLVDVGLCALVLSFSQH